MKIAICSSNSYNFWGWLVLLVALCLLSSIYVAKIPMLPIALILFFINLIIMNNGTRGIALLLFSSKTLGAVFDIFHVPFPAFLLVLFLGFFFLKDEIRNCTFSNVAVQRLLLVFLIFAFWFLLGPMHAYSQSKLVYIVCVGISSFVAWNVAMKSSNIEYLKLALFLGVNSLIFVSIAYDVYFFDRPDNILDFNFFRDSYTLLSKDSSMLLTYHSVGIPALIGVAVLVSYENLNVKSPSFIVTFLLLVMLLLISQTRQAIFGLFLILPIRIFLSDKIQLIGKLCAVFLLLMLFLYVLTSMDSSVIQESLHSDNSEELVNRDYQDAETMIKDNMVLGTGLGGYSRTGERAYPHNIFLELLCETGILGTFLLSFVVFIPIFLKIKNLKMLSASNLYLVLVIIGFGIRAMASSDLTESISFIAALLIFFNCKRMAFQLK